MKFVPIRACSIAWCARKPEYVLTYLGGEREQLCLDHAAEAMVDERTSRYVATMRVGTHALA